MNHFWAIFQRQVTDLSMDERVLLALVLLASVALVVIAFSVLLQVARRLEVSDSGVEGVSTLLRKGVEHIANADYYGDRRQVSHTD